MAALHQGVPSQMTLLEDSLPWLHPAHCFSLVIAVAGFEMCFLC